MDQYVITEKIESNFAVIISDSPADQRWDAFVEKQPYTNYTQSSQWGRARSVLGWQSERICIQRDGTIIAGLQVLRRPILQIGRFVPFGYIGHIQKGPVLRDGKMEEVDYLCTVLGEYVRKHHIHYLRIRPATHEIANLLAARGYIQCTPEHATALLNLTPSIEKILQNMRKSVRRNIRLADREGLCVREGNIADLDIFYNLLTASGKKMNFAIFPKAFYAYLLEQLQPYKQIKLLLAEYKNKTIAALLAITFGDTVTTWASASQTKDIKNQEKLHANEILEWQTIKWAKENGYKYYDFDGLDAALVTNPEAKVDGVSVYKMGYGSEATPLPGQYEFIPNPVWRKIYRYMVPALKSSKAQRLVHLVRGVHLPR